ncbi:MAG: hypothetical protein DHS20C13_10980 [Thermodesulfobacteriota bacterium]|nr:MAG: hypothetical protein DHS20C13_10980 [Thermodesulfobacteriota bacterium]
MRKLLAIATLSLALLSPSLSFADVNVFGVQTPVVKSTVNDQAKGGMVETDFISFYISSKGENIETDSKQVNNSSDQDSLIVFGVSVPTANKS